MCEQTDPLEERLSAVERAVSGGATELADLDDAAAFDERLSELEETVDRLDERAAELDAAVQSIRGFVGGVRAVDRRVEQRADLALAKVERLEARFVDEPGLVPDGIDAPGWDSGRAPLAGGSADEPGAAGSDNVTAEGGASGASAPTDAGRSGSDGSRDECPDGDGVPRELVQRIRAAL